MSCQERKEVQTGEVLAKSQDHQWWVWGSGMGPRVPRSWVFLNDPAGDKDLGTRTGDST